MELTLRPVLMALTVTLTLGGGTASADRRTDSCRTAPEASGLTAPARSGVGFPISS